MDSSGLNNSFRAINRWIPFFSKNALANNSEDFIAADGCAAEPRESLAEDDPHDGAEATQGPRPAIVSSAVGAPLEKRKALGRRKQE